MCRVHRYSIYIVIRLIRCISNFAQCPFRATTHATQAPTDCLENAWLSHINMPPLLLYISLTKKKYGRQAKNLSKLHIHSKSTHQHITLLMTISLGTTGIMKWTYEESKQRAGRASDYINLITRKLGLNLTQSSSASYRDWSPSYEKTLRHGESRS